MPALTQLLASAATYRGKDLFELEPEDRARSGLFMSFQSPVEVPGVSNAEFLRLSANARRMAQGVPELDPLEFYGFITPKVSTVMQIILKSRSGPDLRIQLSLHLTLCASIMIQHSHIISSCLSLHCFSDEHIAENNGLLFSTKAASLCHLIDERVCRAASEAQYGRKLPGQECKRRLLRYDIVNESIPASLYQVAMFHLPLMAFTRSLGCRHCPTGYPVYIVTLCLHTTFLTVSTGRG